MPLSLFVYFFNYKLNCFTHKQKSHQQFTTLSLVDESCPVEIRPLSENPGKLKPGKNKPGRIIQFTQIWILEEELDSDEDVHVDLVVPLLEIN